MSSYKMFTKKLFLDKLKAGGYKNASGANRAIGKTGNLSTADKMQLKEAVQLHFSNKEEVRAARRRETKRAWALKKKGKKQETPTMVVAHRTADERQTRQMPMLSFVEIAKDRTLAQKLLKYVRAALDTEMTLPDLAKVLESV